MVKLSIVILNYNTNDLTLACVSSILRYTHGLDYEIIVVDNGSSEELPKSKNYKLITNKTNLGFAGGNNSARSISQGEYIVFLNSDTEVFEDTLKRSVAYLDQHKEVGALTCKIVLPNGSLDKDARRSFPTPWVALTHFSGLDRLMPRSKLFSKYWYGYKSGEVLQEVDAIEGAFFMTRKKILDEIDWFSEDYFLDGEDIDLSWKVKNAGYKIIYFPEVSILHIKKASKKKRSLRSKMAGVNSMEIFYKKRLWENYPLFLNVIVIISIYILKGIRFGKAVVGK